MVMYTQLVLEHIIGEMQGTKEGFVYIFYKANSFLYSSCVTKCIQVYFKLLGYIFSIMQY